VLRGTKLYQHIAEASIDAGGIIKDHLYNRAATIFGGTSEIQRNIVAKGVLGL
jgi:alkylation response protein AidB-like acyl-CoA dehydrogenase